MKDLKEIIDDKNTNDKIIKIVKIWKYMIKWIKKIIW